MSGSENEDMQLMVSVEEKDRGHIKVKLGKMLTRQGRCDQQEGSCAKGEVI